MRNSRRPPSQKWVNGKPLCKNCEGPVPPNRRSFCSKDCYYAHAIIYDAGFMRAQLYKRDRGKCVTCGCNATKAYKAFLAARGEAKRYLTRLAGHHKWQRFFDFQRLNGHHMDQTQRRRFENEVDKQIREELDRLIPDPGWTSGRSTGWDADHIIPVAEGGLKLGLDNLRTLCHPCHKKETAALAGRLSKKGQAGHPAHPDLFHQNEQTTT